MASQHCDDGIKGLKGELVPTYYQQLRLDRLTSEDKRLLQAAAVIGKEVPFALLASSSFSCT